MQVETADNLKRDKPTAGRFGANDSVRYSTPPRTASAAPRATSPSDWIVFRVTAVTDPKLDANSPDAKRIEEVVQRQETNDLIGEYVAWLENDLGTSVNQTALAQAVGSGAPEPDTN